MGFDAGPWFRPLEDFASDETEQNKLYWTDTRMVDGANPMVMGGKNSGKAVGGSTVHFAMVSLRFRPEWFKSRSALGYGADWPLDWREMWNYYARAEQALKISGPVTYPWGPKRPRYPYRAHELNGAAELLARGRGGDGYQVDADAAGHRVGAARRLAALRLSRLLPVRLLDERQAKPAVTFIPRALAAGAEIRDLAMVGRIETEPRRARHRRALSSARGDGASRRRATSWSPAMRSRRRACCWRRPTTAIPTASPTAPAWSARTS